MITTEQDSAAKKPKVDAMVLDYKDSTGKQLTCDLDPAIVLAVANSFDAASKLARPGEGPTWSTTRPPGVGEPKKRSQDDTGEEQPECCYYINGQWVCW